MKADGGARTCHIHTFTIVVRVQPIPRNWASVTIAWRDKAASRAKETDVASPLPPSSDRCRILR
jgi:hypothetical protein